MIIEARKILLMTSLLTISITMLVISVSVLPIYAHNPPYKDSYWYSNADPDLCFIDSELNRLNVNRNAPGGQLTNPATQIKAEVNDARQIINTAISGLNMQDDGTTCTYPFIQVGAADLEWQILAQTANSDRYDNQTYRSSYFDFNTDFNWQIESDSCDWFHDKDLEWLAIHELGHALSLRDHISIWDHSMMKDTCSTKYQAVQTVDANALGARYP